jgi:hypothetical protein
MGCHSHLCPYSAETPWIQKSIQLNATSTYPDAPFILYFIGLFNPFIVTLKE